MKLAGRCKDGRIFSARFESTYFFACMRAAEVGLREGGQWNGCSRLDMMRSDAALDQPIVGCDRPLSVWLCPRTSKSGLSPLADNSRIDFTVQPGVTKRRRRADRIPCVWRFHRTCFSLRVEQPPAASVTEALVGPSWRHVSFGSRLADLMAIARLRFGRRLTQQR
jgi:hypothetical protein